MLKIRPELARGILSPADDDEEDIERASDPLMSRDIVRDCLEKDPMDRTDDDIGKIFHVFHLQLKTRLFRSFRVRDIRRLFRILIRKRPKKSAS